MSAKAVAFLMLALVVAAFQPAYSQNTVTPEAGAFYVDPATPHCLAWRWFITGDDNTNATCTVQFKKTADLTWKDAMPALRIHRDTVDRNGTFFFTGNLFASSILSLDPGSLYDVKLHMNDPDGGTFDTTLSMATAAYPPYFTGNTIHLYPAGYSGTMLTPNYSTLPTALAAATAGTVILVHPGTYTGGFTLNKSGTANAPIVLRGAVSEGAVYFDATDLNTVLFYCSGLKFFHIEDITMRDARIAVQCPGAEGLVVRNCQILNVNEGIIIKGTPGKGCFFMNNQIIGRTTFQWFPRTNGDNMGIIPWGKGMVVCHNTISKFWDCMEFAYTHAAIRDVKNPPALCMDAYNNDFSNAGDDLTELDYTYCHTRYWNNRCMNSESGFSTQPLFGGPAYVFRNIFFNCGNTGLKLHNGPSGILIFNNTFGAAFQSNNMFLNTTLKNNLFIGSSWYGDGDSAGYVMETGSPDYRTVLDYNGYLNRMNTFYPPACSYRKILKWYPTTGNCDDSTVHRCSTVVQLYSEHGLEQHGIEVEFTDLKTAFMHVPGTTYDSTQIDFSLTSATATPVDKGCVLPGITDGYTGTAPDLGALEYGVPAPRYGYLGGTMPIGVLNAPRISVGNGMNYIRFNPSVLSETFIAQLQASAPANIKLEVFDISGRIITSLANVQKQGLRGILTGLHTGRNALPNGLYMIKLQAGQQKIEAMVLKVR